MINTLENGSRRMIEDDEFNNQNKIYKNVA